MFKKPQGGKSQQSEQSAGQQHGQDDQAGGADKPNQDEQARQERRPERKALKVVSPIKLQGRIIPIGALLEDHPEMPADLRNSGALVEATEGDIAAEEKRMAEHRRNPLGQSEG